MKTFSIFLRNSLVAGILALTPVLITFYLVRLIFNKFSGFLQPFFNRASKLAGYEFPSHIEQVISFAIVIFFIMFIGILAKNYVGRKFLNIIELVFSKIPMVRSIYGAIRQIVDAFQTTGGNNFKKVVMLEYPRKGVYHIGFITKDTSSFFNEKIGETCVSVFIPTTPNPTSGFILLVPNSQVYDVNMTVEQGIKFIISAGLVEPEHIKLMDKADK